MSFYTALKKLTYRKLSELKSIIPESWRIARGKNVFSILNGISNSNLELGEGDLLYIKVSDMNNPNNIPTIISSNEKCKLLNKDLENKLIPINSIIFPKRGAAIFTNKVGIMGGRGTLDPNLIALYPKNDILNHKYLFYYIDYFNLSNICENAGLPQLNKKDLGPLRILLPPIIEQRSIISILSNVDYLIYNTREIIEMLQKLKKGLMQRLFSNGIKHKEFKESRLGKIPKEWEISTLKNLIKLETGKRAKGGALNEGNVASIGGEHIDNFGNVIWDTMKFITDNFYEEMNKGKVELYDILVVKDGATTGKTGFVKKLKYNKVAINEHVFIVRSKDKNNLLNSFLYYILFSGIGQSQMIRKMHGIIGGITRKDMNSVIVPVPNINEQKIISEIFLNIDKRIDNEKKFEKKLKKIKKGLMQDLLTGKKRVKVN